MFGLISDDEQYVLNFTGTLDAALITAGTFFDQLTTDKKMEGIVLKPDFIVPSIAPFLKVRNEEYLTMVYGYDYKTSHKYDKLIKQKSIRRKVSTSIKEFNLGLMMLEFKVDEVSFENVDYLNTVIDFLFEEKKEKDIDPRL